MSKRGADHLIVSPTMAQLPKKPDSKSSPEKEIPMMDKFQEVAKELVDDSAPKWFVNAFAYLMKELHTIKLDKDVDNVKAELKNDISNLEKKVCELEAKTQEQDNTIKVLENEVLALQTYSRKDNLLIDGISESPNEDVSAKLRVFFKEKLGILNAEEIQFVRCHRLGRPPHMTPQRVDKPRTIIVRFLMYADREKVWRASWGLKDKVQYVKEDFPDKVKKNRRVKSVKRCSLRGDRLIIDGIRYTVDNMELLPPNLRWTSKGQRYFPEQDATFFFGEQSFLSNFYKCGFSDGKDHYTCVEQYYLQQQSLFFQDEHSAQNIMKADHPRNMKAISHRIKGFNEAKWRKVARSVMLKACQMKFTQNNNLRKKLLETKGELVEANGRDCYFSCGIQLSDPAILDKSLWLGENILGQILTQLRKDLSQN